MGARKTGLGDCIPGMTRKGGCLPDSQHAGEVSRTGGAACLHQLKSTGNVLLPLTMGGDCSRWYL